MTAKQLTAIRERTRMTKDKFACTLEIGYMTLYRWEQPTGNRNARKIHNLFAEGIVAIVNRVMAARDKNWKPLEITDYVRYDNCAG